MWLFCHLGHIQWCLIQWQIGVQFRVFGRPLQVNHNTGTEDFGGNPYSLSEKEVLACSLALVEAEYLTMGPQFKCDLGCPSCMDVI